MSKFGISLQKHKNSDNSATNGNSNLKLIQKVSCIYVPIVPEF